MINNQLPNVINNAKNKQITVGNSKDDINLEKIKSAEDSIDDEQSIEDMYDEKQNIDSAILKTDHSISANKRGNGEILQEIEGLDRNATDDVVVSASKSGRTKTTRIITKGEI